MKCERICVVIFLFIVMICSNKIQAQEDKPVEKLVGISGESVYHKYIIEMVGNSGDTIKVFDSSSVFLPLKSSYYFLRVYRITRQGELKEFRIKGYNMVLNLSNDSSYTQQFTNKYMADPLQTYFKSGRKGGLISVGSIEIWDEKDKVKNVGSYQLIYQ